MDQTNNNKTRVVVAMSGGVDSSVAAALLKEQGYDVIGVSLKLWDYDEEERQLTGKTCCSLDDIADAKDVCDTLDIPFYAFNHKPEFQKNVIDVFVNMYTQGQTPNPCILCNQNIKFSVLLKEAEKMGAKYLATGHYASVYQDKKGAYHLAKGKDSFKDQSYVLFHLNQDELSRVLFPLGKYTKDEIRALAAKYNLITKDKKESMEICFIPNNDHASFIAKNYPQKKREPGSFVDRQGHFLGKHKGIDAYTIGQRKGLGIGWGKKMYVSQIKSETNEVVLEDDSNLYNMGVIADRFNFLQPPTKKKYGAKIRYQRNEIEAEIVHYDNENKLIKIKFPHKARAISPGQALVLYDNKEVIGGGWVKKAVYSDIEFN